MTGGRWVVVSGAAGSLGGAVTRHYLAAGYHVLALDRDGERLAVLASSGQLVAETLDLTDEAAVAATLDRAIPRGMKIALLVNAAGLIWNEPVLAQNGGRITTHGIDTWRRTIEANLTGPFVLASVVALRMARAGGGVVVNFSSVAARGNPGQSAYSAAKAGIEGMTRAMARELGPLGIRVNAVAPGFIDVPTTRAALSEQALADKTARTPLGRLGSVDEVVAAVVFLEQNAFLTGVVLDIDGGLHL